MVRCTRAAPALLMALGAAWSPAAPLAAQDTYVVTSVADAADAAPGDAVCDDGTGACTLRAALEEANASAGADSIHFDIAGVGPHTIVLAGALPSITDPVVIDGYTQAGASPNTNGPRLGTNAVLMVEVNAVAAATGLTLAAGNSTVRGLVIHGAASRQIALASDGNVVEGSFIGTDPTGTVSIIRGFGLATSGTVDDNLVGGSTPAARNVILGTTAIQLDAGVGHRIEGNLIGVDATGTEPLGGFAGIGVNAFTPSVTIGGTSPGAGNVISGLNTGILVRFATDIRIEGNLIGTDVSGTAVVGNSNDGIQLGADTPSNFIGGSTAGAGNVISGNAMHGITLLPFPANTGNVVQGNYVGTDVAGSTALPNGVGVKVVSPATTVGGTAAGEGNLLSGNDSLGLELGGTDQTVLGNRIGTDVTGLLALGNGADGVEVVGTGHVVGGSASGAANTIAFNGGDGISMPTGSAVTFSRNRIHSNAGLGIDLGGDGVTPNDDGDGDSGANGLQNFPVVALAWASGEGIAGTFSGAASSTFTLELFASAACDASDHGEGETFLTSATVDTDGAGAATFDIVSPVALATGDALTATATDAAGNTSELSSCIPIVAEPTFTVTSTDDGDDGACSVGHCSLREAIHAANAHAGVEEIHFLIPGDGPHLIEPAGDLPVITDGVTIDGFSQPGASPNTRALEEGSDADLRILLGRTGDVPFIQRGLQATADDVTVRGLVVDDFLIALDLGGDRSVVEGSYLGVDPSGTIPGIPTRVFLAGSSSRMGGAAPASRNVVAGLLALQGAATVHGNYIGVDASGRQALPYDSGPGYVRLFNSNAQIIGGSGPGEGNVIAGGILAPLILAQDNVIQGNHIGTDASGTLDFDNPAWGISLLGSGNRIGGDAPGKGNVIAFNDLGGVTIGLGAGNRIRGNAIRDNGGLGIDLGAVDPDGLTPNDPGDADTGGNDLQNFPVLTAALTGGAGLVEGALNSLGSTAYDVELFASPACDPSDHGQGATPLGSASVTTDAAGDVTFAVDVDGAAAPGDAVTATATDPAGSTSEFSACVTAVGFSTEVAPSDDAVALGASGAYDVTVTALGGAFDRDVTLSCTGLPAGSACAFDPATVQPGAGSSSATLAVSTTDGSTPTGSHAFGVSGRYASIEAAAATSITVAAFSLDVSPDAATVSAGAASFTVTVEPVGGPFGDVVTLACPDVPAALTCTFAPASVTPGGAAVSSTLTVSASAGAGAPDGRGLPGAPGPRRTLPWLLALAAGLAALRVAAGRRRAPRWVVAAAVLVWLAGYGCGKEPTKVEVPTTHTLTVTATSGGLARSESISVTVP